MIGEADALNADIISSRLLKALRNFMQNEKLLSYLKPGGETSWARTAKRP